MASRCVPVGSVGIVTCGDVLSLVSSLVMRPVMELLVHVIFDFTFLAV